MTATRLLYGTAAAINLVLGVLLLRSDNAKPGGAVLVFAGLVFLIAFAFTYAGRRP